MAADVAAQQHAGCGGDLEIGAPIHVNVDPTPLGRGDARGQAPDPGRIHESSVSQSLKQMQAGGAVGRSEVNLAIAVEVGERDPAQTPETCEARSGGGVGEGAAATVECEHRPPVVAHQQGVRKAIAVNIAPVDAAGERLAILCLRGHSDGGCGKESDGEEVHGLG